MTHLFYFPKTKEAVNLNIHSDNNSHLKTAAINWLRHLLTEGESGSNHFTVFGLEAGVGKSIKTDEIIAEHIATGGRRHFLVVKKFVSAVNESVNRINGNNAQIVAAGITADNWTEHKKSLSMLPHTPVLIVTHKRYLNLAQDAELRTYFERNRHTLVIDECIEPPTYKFSEFEHSTIISYLRNRELRKSLDNLCEPFLDELAIPTTNTVRTCSLQVDPAQLSDFRDRVHANWNMVLKPAEILKYLDTLEILSKCICYHNSNSITGIESGLKLWTLQNNVILDANAGIDKRYDCSPNMIVNVQPKIHTFEKSIIRVAPLNSSKNGKKLLEDYHDKIALAVKKWKSEKDKTLIVCHQNEQEALVESLRTHGFNNIGIDDNCNGEDIAVAHLYDILGKNHWRDFTQVWVIASPIEPMELYPLKRDFFTGKSTLGEETLMSGNFIQCYRAIMLLTEILAQPH